VFVPVDVFQASIMFTSIVIIMAARENIKINRKVKPMMSTIAYFASPGF
jgi:hypothetical protein